MKLITESCPTRTPLGTPVEPDVKLQYSGMPPFICISERLSSISDTRLSILSPIIFTSKFSPDLSSAPNFSAIFIDSAFSKISFTVRISP